MNRRYPYRPAFSLLELLVVIALLSVLAALAAGTYFRIRNSQQSNSTESTLKKLSVGLEDQYRAERDRADKEFTSSQIRGGTMAGLMGFCGVNEKDRARAVWLYFRIKNEFPQTFNEARSNTILTSPSGTVFQIPPKETFRNVPVVVDLPPPNEKLTAEDYADQAAALLFLILSEKSVNGVQFDLDALNAFTATREVVVDATVNPPRTQSFRMFVDSWGTRISYVRFLSNSEIDDPPYARFGTNTFGIVSNLPAGKSNNPFDTKARFTQVGWTNFQYFASSAGVLKLPVTSASLATAEQLLRRNWIPTVVSSGPNREMDGLDMRSGGQFPYSNIGVVQFGATAGVDGMDNVFSYRLRRFGAHGD